MQPAAGGSVFSAVCLEVIQTGQLLAFRNWGGVTQKHGQHGDLISLLSFFQNKENRLKSFGCMRFVIVIEKFWVGIAMNCQVLTCYMNASYGGYKGASSPSLWCIVSIL
jgi:hypothetical protein